MKVQILKKKEKNENSLEYNNMFLTELLSVCYLQVNHIQRFDHS